MPEFLYKPFPEADSIPNNIVDEISNKLENSWKMLKVKPNHFLNIGKYIVVFNDTQELAEKVALSTKGKAEDKRTKDSPKELQEEIKNLKIEYDLTQKQINQLIKELKKKEFKALELEKQIDLLKNRAKNLGDERRLEKIKKNFDKFYKKFFDVLNTELNDLNENDKLEITNKLRIMAATIEDTITSLNK